MPTDQSDQSDQSDWTDRTDPNPPLAGGTKKQYIPPVFSVRIKRGVFWLEGLNALATTYYFYFIFFVLKRRFGFEDRQNLLWAAALGAMFCCAAYVGGKVGQHRGYLKALGIGFTTMAVSLTLGTFLDHPAGHLVVMLMAAAGMCFTWPNLEALAAERESPARLQRNIGIYNLIWSGGNGVAYFTGGALLEHFGWRSIFVLPAGLHILQLLLLAWMSREVHHDLTEADLETAPELHLSTVRERRRSPVPPARFMKMAWVANPFSYVAINTAVPLIPFLAGRLDLSPTLTGIVCSTWFFARTAAFGLLWKWDGWHYRYRFLSAAYIGMAIGFTGIVLASSVPMLLLAQILFGFSLGLIYYSSLFYSMDVGETKGEHGGWHEATIGAGIFTGPAVAAFALHFFPADEQAGVKAVGLVLLAGFVLLNLLRWTGVSRVPTLSGVPPAGRG